MTWAGKARAGQPQSLLNTGLWLPLPDLVYYIQQLLLLEYPMTNMVESKEFFEKAAKVENHCQDGLYQKLLEGLDKEHPQFNKQFPRQRWMLNALAKVSERWHYVYRMLYGGFTSEDMDLLWHRANELEAVCVAYDVG